MGFPSAQSLTVSYEALLHWQQSLVLVLLSGARLAPSKRRPSPHARHKAMHSPEEFASALRARSTCL